MAKKTVDTNRGGFHAQHPQVGKRLPGRNPYPSTTETGRTRGTHGFTQTQIVGVQGGGNDYRDRRLYPDIHVLPAKIVGKQPETGPGTDAQKEHIRRMRANKQITG